jgi:hypothetical protein
MWLKPFPLNPEANISFTFYFTPNKVFPVFFVSSSQTFFLSISCVVTIMTSSVFLPHSTWKKQQYRKWKGLSKYSYTASPHLKRGVWKDYYSEKTPKLIIFDSWISILSFSDVIPTFASSVLLRFLPTLTFLMHCIFFSFRGYGLVRSSPYYQ